MEDEKSDSQHNRTRSRGQVIEAQLSWVTSLILFFSTIYVTLRLDFLWMAFGITSLSLYVLPIITTRDPFKAIPWEMTALVTSPILLHISEGSRALSENLAWWDDMTALAFAFSLSTIGLLLTIELQMFTTARMNTALASFFVIMFTMAVSGLWQVGEYIGGLVTGHMLVDTNGEAMGVLIYASAGGIMMGFVYGAYLKVMGKERRRKFGLVHLWEVTTRRRG
jgi:hypothetical protein